MQDNKWRSLIQQRNDSSAREHLENINLNADGESQVLEDTLETTTRNIPPYDASADTPEKAYLLDEIIPKGERVHLLDILDDLHSGTDIPSKSYPSFVFNRMHKLREIQVHYLVSLTLLLNIMLDHLFSILLLSFNLVYFIPLQWSSEFR